MSCRVCCCSSQITHSLSLPINRWKESGWAGVMFPPPLPPPPPLPLSSPPGLHQGNAALQRRTGLDARQQTRRLSSCPSSVSGDPEDGPQQSMRTETTAMNDLFELHDLCVCTCANNLLCVTIHTIISQSIYDAIRICV